MSGNGFKRDVGPGAVTFRDRVDTMTWWFREWSPCEQTISVYSLLYQLSPSHVKFLSTVMDVYLQDHAEDELEGEANDPDFINSLYSSNEEQALEKILARLPLLRSDSASAVKEYMNLLPKVLLGCREDTSYLDKCRQFLSLALVHPAFKQDRGNLEYWLHYLDDKWRKILDKNGLAYGRQQQFRPNKSSTLPHYPHTIDPPPSTGGWSKTVRPYTPWDGSDEHIAITYPIQKPVTEGEVTSSSPDNQVHGSTSDEEQPVSGGEGSASKEGGGAPLRNTFEEQGSGMSEVPGWLKGLRLHKYQELFQVMGYDEMVSITEDYLEKKGVTKGARNKIIQHINSLSQRYETLIQMEKDIAEAKSSGQADPRTFITSLHSVLKTPMKPYTAPALSPGGSEEGARDAPVSRGKDSDRLGGGSGGEEGSHGDKEHSHNHSWSEDDSSSGSDQEQEEYADQLLRMDVPTENLPLLIARVMYRIYDMLYTGPGSGVEEALVAFIKMVDQALCHQAFQVEERKLFFEWKQECQRNLRFLSPRRARGRGYPHTFGGVSSRGATGGFSKKPNTFSRPAHLRSSGMQSGSKSSTIPRLEQRQPMLGPFAGGVPLTTAMPFGAEGSLMDRNYKGTQLTGSQGSLSAPRYIKSKDTDQHMDDLCRRVAAHALSDDPLDGMSFSLTGKSNLKM